MKYNEPLLPGKYYHIYNHAVGDENLFRHNENYKYFLKRYSDYILPVAFSYAYCLLPNHFHFLIKVKTEEDLKAAYELKYAERIEKPEFVPENFVMQGFSNLFNSYSKAYNKKYERKGALFLDYMKRKQVENRAYFANLVHYIHYNAVLHELCKNVNDWDYTSYHAYKSDKPTRLQRDEVLGWFNGRDSLLEQHKSRPQADLWLEF